MLCYNVDIETIVTSKELPQMFIVKKVNGQYVSNPNTNGTGSSYTLKLKLARIYPTQEEATADCCGNERVERVEDQLSIH